MIDLAVFVGLCVLLGMIVAGPVGYALGKRKATRMFADSIEDRGLAKLERNGGRDL